MTTRQEDTEIDLEGLASVKIKDEYSPSVKKFLKGMKKMEREENYPLNILRKLSTKAVRSIVEYKAKNSHMISFPKFWFMKWNSRNVKIELHNNSLYVYNASEKEATARLHKIGGTHYIPIKESVYRTLGYPNELQLVFNDDYLLLTVTKAEMERIRIRQPEIDRRKKNEQMKQNYARMV